MQNKIIKRGFNNPNNPINIQNKILKTLKISKTSAFSLIELSIVLIIIGLLVAGITGGASLIESAKIRAFINEAREYNQASYIFMAEKNRLPGDLNNTGKIGLNSGYIYEEGDFPAPYDGSNSKYGTPNRPVVGPFIELYLSDIIDFEPKNTDIATAHITLGKNGAIPRSKYENDIIIYYQYYNNPNSTTDRYDAGLVGNLLTFNSSDLFLINPKLIKNLDQKLDDGKFNTGKVRGHCQGSNSDIALNSYENAIENNQKCAYFFIKI